MRKDDKMSTYTWQQFFESTLNFAKALHALGVPERTCVNIMGHNSPEHFIALMGSISANCIVSEIYTTNGPEACLYQL